MKFEEKEVKRPATEGMRKDLNNVGEMKAGTDNPADVFQAQLYNSGRNLLAQLDKIEGTGANADKSYEELVEQLQQLRDLAAQYQGNYSQMGEYPAWEYKADSKLRGVMVETYTRMFGKEPTVVAIHAGLECGLLSEKLPGLDCVSIGPDMQDIHTSREKLSIASTKRTWDFLLEILKEL